MKIRPLKTLSLWGAAFGATPFFAALAGISALAGDKTGKVWWWSSRTWGKNIVDSSGATHFIVKGVEVLYDGQPYIVMSNHESHLDPPALIASSQRPIGFLTKQELQKLPIFGWALEATGHVFIDRKKRDQAVESINRAANKISEGRCVAVFPEGTRSLDGELGSFKKGGFVLAVQAQVPIVPVGLAGTRHILPSQSSTVRGKGPIAIVYGEPIPTKGYTLETKDELMAKVAEAISELRAQARAIVAEHV